MGCNKSKTAKDPFNESDYSYLSSLTGLNKTEINRIYAKLSPKYPKGKLDKNEFKRLYDQHGIDYFIDILGVISF